MQLKYAMLLLMLFVVGCSEQVPTAGDGPLSTPGITNPNFNIEWAEDRYPTEEEIEDSGLFPSIDADAPAAVFGSYDLAVMSEARFHFVNIGSANLKATVVDTTGAEFISRNLPWTFDNFIPYFSHRQPMHLKVPLLGRKCGLQALTEIELAGKLVVLRFEIGTYKPTEWWGRGTTIHGHTAIQAECPPADEGDGDGEGGDDDYCEDGEDPACWDEPECGEDGCEDGPVCRWEEWGVFAWIDGQWVLLHSWWEYCGGEGGGPGGGREDSIDPPITVAGLQEQSVQVVLVPDRDFHYGDAESVVRRDAGRSTIFLRESTATASVLTSACRGLSALERQAEGSSHNVSGLIKLTGNGSPSPTRGSATVLSELRRAPIAHHTGVGAHRTVSLNGQRLAKIGCR